MSEAESSGEEQIPAGPGGRNSPLLSTGEMRTSPATFDVATDSGSEARSPSPPRHFADQPSDPSRASSGSKQSTTFGELSVAGTIRKRRDSASEPEAAPSSQQPQSKRGRYSDVDDPGEMARLRRRNDGSSVSGGRSGKSSSGTGSAGQTSSGASSASSSSRSTASQHRVIPYRHSSSIPAVYHLPIKSPATGSKSSRKQTTSHHGRQDLHPSFEPGIKYVAASSPYVLDPGHLLTPDFPRSHGPPPPLQRDAPRLAVDADATGLAEQREHVTAREEKSRRSKSTTESARSRGKCRKSYTVQQKLGAIALRKSGLTVSQVSEIPLCIDDVLCSN